MLNMIFQNENVSGHSYWLLVDTWLSELGPEQPRPPFADRGFRVCNRLGPFLYSTLFATTRLCVHTHTHTHTHTLFVCNLENWTKKWVYKLWWHFIIILNVIYQNENVPGHPCLLHITGWLSVLFPEQSSPSFSGFGFVQLRSRVYSWVPPPQDLVQEPLKRHELQLDHRPFTERYQSDRSISHAEVLHYLRPVNF